jgi:UDP-glucuronate 4-epimerase
VRLIEEAVGRPAAREFLPMQPGDVLETFADRADLEQAVGFWPQTALGEGIRRFVDWFGTYRSQAAAR